MRQLNHTLETNELGNAQVQVEYRLNSGATTSTVIIQQKPMLDEQSSTALRNSSQAWLALGQFWLAVNNYQAAILCAKAGLEELGDNYINPTAFDDTQMKLWVASERIGEGHVEDGADVILRVLESRIHLKINKNRT